MTDQLEKQIEYYKRLREVYKDQIETYNVALEQLDKDIINLRQKINNKNNQKQER